MPNPKTQTKTVEEVLASPIRSNGQKRRYYDSEVRRLALRVTPTGEAAFTLDDRVIGKPSTMSLADAREIARGAGASAVQPFRHLEVCAGLGSASLAFEMLGWQCAGMAEIDPEARAFLSQRFPRTKLHGDFRKIKPAQVGHVDLLVGGPPCQAFSKDNRKKVNDDPRRDLTLEFLDLARSVGATWFVFENVPAIVGDEIWPKWLRQADEDGYGLACRVLDARQFGLPTRRKRLFVVGHLGRPEPAYRALFEFRRASFPHPEEGIAKQARGARRREDGPMRAQAVAISKKSNEFTDFLPTLRNERPADAALWIDDMVLRKLTITELERCMGFPDGWTAFEWRGKPASYNKRTALLGNAFCPPILHWIGEGIANEARRGLRLTLNGKDDLPPRHW